MLLKLLDIVLPVFLVAAVGFLFGKFSTRRRGAPDMDFINYANVMVFCPALIFSALLNNPVNLAHGWPLIVGGTLIIVVPGMLLTLIRRPGLSRAAFLSAGMYRNTGNLGIPLMMLAYGKGQLGDIVVLFTISNLLGFSVGPFLLSGRRERWQWLLNPNIWAAILGIAVMPYRHAIPGFVTTAIDLTGQIAIPLMLFGLGVRIAQSQLGQLGLALRVNGLYLLAGLLCLPLLWLLPLTPAWQRLLVLSALLPPAVTNYVLAEQYHVAPRSVANVVMLGNLLSIATVPVIVWATLTWI
ncbi:MAG TPA: AEC family transporter [Nevskiaceae bacterium]|nr:AEC family transporter [Nevskiaceae bacterium]